MSYMFSGAKSFNQNIYGWDATGVELPKLTKSRWERFWRLPASVDCEATKKWFPTELPMAYQPRAIWAGCVN